MAEQVMELEQAKTCLKDLVERATHGEEVILTEGGRPVAKLIAVESSAESRQFGSARGLIHIAEDFDAPLEEFRDYM